MHDVRHCSRLHESDSSAAFAITPAFLQTRGTDYDLVPKASARVPVVRTIYAEADGQPLPEPDPANSDQATFSWMTAHRFEPDHVVKYPFSDLDSLRDWSGRK